MKILKSALPREERDDEALRETVRQIIGKVRKEGDQALAYYNQEFDHCQRDSLRVSPEEIAAAYEQVSPAMIQDIQAAAANIKAFAQAQRSTISELQGFAPHPGMDLGHRVIPVDAACCYVPGGNYPLYSTALMLGISAKVAGVSRVVGCSPAVKGLHKIDPKTLVAMDIAGMDEIYVTGGAQAIAAFTYGTDSISPVNIIVGPGNAFVTEAKRQCYGKVGIDFLAGPSEVLIISDGSGDVGITAADLLAQSEHDKMAKGLLITTDEAFGLKVMEEVEKQLQTLETAAIASVSWQERGEVLLVDSLEEAAALSNEIAPEHLEIHVVAAKEESLIAQLRNYGGLFIGQHTAEVFGDYASGPNHTLPTIGAGKYTGGVGVGTFLKTCTYQRLTPEASKALAPLVERLAVGEGLMGHAAAAKARK